MEMVNGLQYITEQGTVIRLFPSPERNTYLLAVDPRDGQEVFNLSISHEFLEALSAMHMAIHDHAVEKEKESREAILKRPVTDLEMTVRINNRLEQMGIRTIGELVMCSRQELLNVGGLGKVSLREIVDCLDAQNLGLSVYNG